MKKKLWKWVVICFLIVVTGQAFGTAKAEAAVQTLTKGKIYSIDLNGGTAERVGWTTKTYKKYNETFRLKIDGKYVVSYKPNCGSGCYIDKVEVLDVDTSDKYKEIFVSYSGYESNWGVFIIRYSINKKPYIYSDYAKAASYINGPGRVTTTGLKTNGKGTFYLCADTPFWSSAFGFNHVLLPAKIAGGKIKFYTSSSYTLVNPSRYISGGYYTLKTSMKFYTTSACTTTKGTLASGTKFIPSKIHVLSASGIKSNLSVYVKTSTGKTGWLKFPANQTGYLTYVPMWG